MSQGFVLTGIGWLRFRHVAAIYVAFAIVLGALRGAWEGGSLVRWSFWVLELPGRRQRLTSRKN